MASKPFALPNPRNTFDTKPKKLNKLGLDYLD